MTNARLRPIRSPTLLPTRMKAAETSASSAMALCTSLTFVPRSSTTAAMDTFMSDVSTTSTNMAAGRRMASRRLFGVQPDPASAVTRALEASADISGKGPRALEWPVDLGEVDGVVEVLALGVARALDVEVVDDEQLLVDVRALDEPQPRRRPDPRTAPECRPGDRVEPHRVARDDPGLVDRRRRGQHRVPEIAVVAVGADVQARVVAGGHGPPRGHLDDRVDAVDQRVLAQEVGEQAVVTGGEAEPAARALDDQAVVPPALRVALLDPRKEDLLVGEVGIEVVRVVREDEGRVEEPPLGPATQVVEDDAGELALAQGSQLPLQPVDVVLGRRLLHVAPAGGLVLPEVAREGELGEEG